MRNAEVIKAAFVGAEPYQKPRGNLPDLVWFEDIRMDLETRDFVEGLLIDGLVSVVWGEPNCGKTFFATDLALHVALGERWFDRDVEQGGAIYVAAEGAYGIHKRVEAYRSAHGLEDARIPFAVLASAVDLCSPDGDTAELIRLIQGAAKKIEGPVKLIVIDTVARVMAGGDENAATDMSSLVRNVDEIRFATGAHVMLVHHCGKDRSKGSRGHSGLKAAIDTEIEIERNAEAKITTARVVKQRELETDVELSFRLKVVEIGIDRRGNPITSCVVERTQEGVGTRGPKLSPAVRQALEVLQNTLATYGAPAPPGTAFPPHCNVVKLELWREHLRKASVTSEESTNERQQWKRISEKLRDFRQIGIWEGLVWVTRDSVTGRDNP